MISQITLAAPRLIRAPSARRDLLRLAKAPGPAGIANTARPHPRPNSPGVRPKTSQRNIPAPGIPVPCPNDTCNVTLWHLFRTTTSTLAMPDSGWYPPSQVCYPPELPAYLKNVHDLKPIAGVPGDAEIIEIHSVIHAANRVSGVPGMHDPRLFMKLADHLFNAQMARYRSKYSLITFPSGATYTPPVLPAHVSVNLEPVAGAPSDEEIIGVQDAVRAYERFSGVAPMFDPHVHMELSQHLFDIQMARHMRLAGEIQPTLEPQASAILKSPAQSARLPRNTVEEVIGATNNAGSGENAARVHQATLSAAGLDVRDLMELSNQLAEQFNQALEQFTKLAERTNTPKEQPDYSNSYCLPSVSLISLGNA
ncbi:hypothetical protein RSAG8_08096, partial [Rhizoctonia solani AG-8 WAC10335]